MKTLLFNPFHKYSTAKLIFWGLLITVIGGILSTYFNARFDGALDLHFTESVSEAETITDGIINLICLVLFLFLAARLQNKKTRLIDLFSTVLISRTPLYLLVFMNWNKHLYLIGEQLKSNLNERIVDDLTFSSLLFLVSIGILTILFLVWYIALLYSGYKVSSNAKGKKSIWFFAVALFLAEIMSKILITVF